jgi:hypothetical protein
VISTQHGAVCWRRTGAGDLGQRVERVVAFARIVTGRTDNLALFPRALQGTPVVAHIPRLLQPRPSCVPALWRPEVSQVNAKNLVDYHDESLPVAPFSVGPGLQEPGQDWRSEHGSFVIGHVREVG